MSYIQGSQSSPHEGVYLRKFMFSLLSNVTSDFFRYVKNTSAIKQFLLYSIKAIEAWNGESFSFLCQKISHFFLLNMLAKNYIELRNAYKIDIVEGVHFVGQDISQIRILRNELLKINPERFIFLKEAELAVINEIACDMSDAILESMEGEKQIPSVKLSNLLFEIYNTDDFNRAGKRKLLEKHLFVLIRNLLATNNDLMRWAKILQRDPSSLAVNIFQFMNEQTKLSGCRILEPEKSLQLTPFAESCASQVIESFVEENISLFVLNTLLKDHNLRYQIFQSFNGALDDEYGTPFIQGFSESFARLFTTAQQMAEFVKEFKILYNSLAKTPDAFFKKFSYKPDHNFILRSFKDYLTDHPNIAKFLAENLMPLSEELRKIDATMAGENTVPLETKGASPL